ncbi:MAG: hypothetical protein PHF84_02300 [bacterium]|nr:hypothetical protein [bacterium]
MDTVKRTIEFTLCVIIICSLHLNLSGRGAASGTILTNVKDYQAGQFFLPFGYHASNLGELIVVYTNAQGDIWIQNGRYYFLNSVRMTNNTTFTVSAGYDINSIPPYFTGNGRKGYYVDYVYIITNRANISDYFFVRVLSQATDDPNWSGNFLSLYINEVPYVLNSISIRTNTGSVAADSVVRIRVRLQVPMAVVNGSTNLFSLEIWNSIWSTNSLTGDQWPGTGAIPPATPDVLDSRDYQRSFVRTTASGVYHAVVVPSADDTIHTIYNFDGTESLGTVRVRINILLDSPPSDPDNLYLVYNIGSAPTGSNPDDRRIKIEGNGINYYAMVLSANDSRIRDGVQFNFIILCDNEIYYRDGRDGFETWSYRCKSILMQKHNVSILNNLINPRKGEKAILFYSLASRSKVMIEVYTLAGEKINTLFNGYQEAGYQNPIYWDGRNENSQEVSEGLYFISFRTEELNEIRKVIVVK